MTPARLGRLVRHEWPLIVLALRGTLAALAALTVAIALKLECPYWAAMTALIVIQPTRGLLLEKSFYRLVGTAAGSLAGLAMLQTSLSPPLLTIMLSLWLAVCVASGNLLYGFRSYAAMVAGCTGAVIAMAGYNNPPQLNDLVFGRIAGITIGIIVSTAVTLLFTRRRSKRELLDRLTTLAGEEIEWLARLLAEGEHQGLNVRRQDILVDIAEIEASVDAVWAGSLDLKKRKRDVRSLIVAQLSLLEAGKLAETHLSRQTSDDAWRQPLAAKLTELAAQLDGDQSLESVFTDSPAILDALRARLPLAGEALTDLIAALELVTNEWDQLAPKTERPAGNHFILHRDWQEAGRAALRAAGSIAAVGTAWHLTGWSEGPLMLMAASIMVSIFSTHDRPSVMLSHILCGASLGVAAAFLVRLLLLPGVSSPLQQVVVSIPVLLAGMIALHHPRTARGAMDAMLFFLFVMQPGLPAVPPPNVFVAGGFAVLAGIGVAIIAFRLLLPIDPARRLRSLVIAISRDLAAMTSADSVAALEKYRARTHHRVLRMLTNAQKLDKDLGQVIEGGLAALAIARCIQQLQGRGEGSPAIMRQTARRLRLAIRQTDTILPMLDDVSGRLYRAMEPERRRLQAIMTTPAAPSLRSDLLFDARKECPCHT